MAATELVRITRLTLCLLQALSTDSVPSTAGRIISSSCFGASGGNGLATWWTYVQPFTALQKTFVKEKEHRSKCGFRTDDYMPGEWGL